MCTMHKPQDVVNFWRALLLSLSRLAFYYTTLYGFTVPLTPSTSGVSYVNKRGASVLYGTVKP